MLAEALGLVGVSVVAAADLPGLHPTRSARLVAPGGEAVGDVGEVDPLVARSFGLPEGRVGWLSVDLRLLLSPSVVTRAPEEITLASRFPSSDVDLAVLVDEAVPASRVAEVLTGAGESCSSRRPSSTSSVGPACPRAAAASRTGCASAPPTGP